VDNLMTKPRPAEAVPVSRQSRRADQIWLPLAVLAFHLSVLFPQNGSATLLATLYLLFVPGTLLLRALGLEKGGAILTVGGSLSCLYAVILLVQLTPVNHPLGTWPMVIGLDALTAVLLAVALIRKPSPAVVLPRRIRGFWFLTLLPLATAAAVEILENGGSSTPVVICLALAGVVLFWALRQTFRDGEGVQTAIYSVALTLMWTFSLRSAGFYGYDIQQEYATFTTTAEAMRWSPLNGDSYMAMLSINALPTALTQVTGLSGPTVYKLLFPMIFALYPVGIFVFARRWLSAPLALTASGLIFLTGSFASQMPALARQEIGLVLFVGLLLAAFPPADQKDHRRGWQVLAVVLGAGLIVSHYSTAYVALAAMALAQVFLMALRLIRGERLGGAVLTLPVVLLLIGICAGWTLGVTQSTKNLAILADDVSQDGAQVLPNHGGNIVQRWLNGNLTATVEPREYFDAAAEHYATEYPWLLSYQPSAQQRFPAIASSAPTVSAVLPISGARYAATTLVRQATNLAIAFGCLLMAWLAIRRRRVDPHLIALVLGVFVITVAIRLSASASSQYNPERLALQTGALLVVPLGLFTRELWTRVSRHVSRVPIGLVAAGALAVVFLDASGLGARLQGGSPPGNLSRSGEYAERFSATDQDLAAAQWLRSQRFPQSTVFADRYGALIVQANEGAEHRGLFADLTPGTLDARSFVYATSSNIVNGRARGMSADATLSSTYEFPTTFLDIYKPLVFDTGWARVYS
jgi:uncharacterized membrane protein